MSKQFLSKERNNVNHFNYYYYTNAFTSEELDRIKTIGNSYPMKAAEVGGAVALGYILSKLPVEAIFG